MHAHKRRVDFSFLIGAPCSSCPQSYRGLRHVPGRSYDVALLLGLAKRVTKTTSVARPQRRRQVHRPLDDRACLPHLFGWLQGKVLVQATPIKVQNVILVWKNVSMCERNKKKLWNFIYVLQNFLIQSHCGSINDKVFTNSKVLSANFPLADWNSCQVGKNK